MSADYDEADVEAAARAMYELLADYVGSSMPWDGQNPGTKDRFTEDAKAALEAAAPSIATRARAQAGEDIARAIKAERASLIDGHNKFAHATIAHYADGLNRGAKLARDTTRAGA